jgi:hypothetical protein
MYGGCELRGIGEEGRRMRREDSRLDRCRRKRGLIRKPRGPILLVLLLIPAREST